MKSKILFSVIIVFFISAKVYSQPFDESKNHDTTSFIDSEGYIHKIGKYNLTLQLDIIRLNKTDYLDSIYSFIYNLKSRIDYISLSDEEKFLDARLFFYKHNIEISFIPGSYTNIGAMNIRIADTSNIFDIVPMLKKTGFFKSIDYFPVLLEGHIPNNDNYF